MKIIIAISLIFLLSCSTSVEKESRDEERRANAQKTSDLLNQRAREKTPPTPFPTLTPSPTPTTIPIPLEDLRQMLDLGLDNPVGAEKKYKGKKIRIEGRIQSLNEDLSVDIIPKFSSRPQNALVLKYGLKKIVQEIKINIKFSVSLNFCFKHK